MAKFVFYISIATLSVTQSFVSWLVQARSVNVERENILCLGGKIAFLKKSINLGEKFSCW